MSKYFKLFETVANYNAAESTLVKPNVSLIKETNKVEYNPYISERYIIYTASEKLNVTWSNETATFGATIKSHTFENGVGTIEFNDNVTKIATTAPYPTSNSAFCYCTNLTHITIPNTVTSISSYAFSDCTNLTTITIPNSVTSIGSSVFYNCSNLTSIAVESGNTVYDSRNNCNAVIETATNTLIVGSLNTVIPDTVTSIGSGAFSGYTSLPVVDNIRYADTCAVEAVDETLSTYALKEDTRFIYSFAFSNCTNLTSITIPDSVTEIGHSAFRSCNSLTSVTIPNIVTSIGDYAFYSCSNLTNITIPDSVTTIGSLSFCDCTKLASIIVEATIPPSLGSNAFSDNASGRKIYVPSASINTYKTATNWKFYASDIEAIPTA